MTFYFYDLETSGVNPRDARVMQFAGQRTDEKLNPVGEPHNFLLSLPDDVLPEPDAILITGITPQKTRADGMSEAEFLKIFDREIATPGTVFAGFNTIRFDDEFIRFMLYRNFYDPYEWQWKDGRGKWDLLDVVRMARALRPEGIKWPFASDGKPTNRLELLTSLNGLDHVNAHDALSDVQACIALARLLKERQSKLFEYLLSMRDKSKVAALVNSNQPFVYSSGKYPSEYEKTTIAINLGAHPGKQGNLVYDLRENPEQFVKMTPEELAKIMVYQKDPDATRLPVKTLQFNRCPAVAPLSVLDDAAKERLKLDLQQVSLHRTQLEHSEKFYNKLLKALDIIDKQRQTALIGNEQLADAQLYDGFVNDKDKTRMSALRAADTADLAGFADSFEDERLNKLVPLYIARNYPTSLSDEQRLTWEAFRQQKLLGGGERSRMARYFHRLGELVNTPGLSNEKRYLLEELQLWGESIMPDLG